MNAPKLPTLSLFLSCCGFAVIILAFFLGFGGCVRIIKQEGPLVIIEHRQKP